ncbi:MAG: hypothetical protein ACOZAO_00745 [Patescibacteria group bacterium]
MFFMHALEKFEKWWETSHAEEKTEMLARFAINEVPEKAEAIDFDTQAEIGAAVIAQEGNLKIYFRFPHADKNIMAWATGSNEAVRAFNMVMHSDWNKAKNTQAVAGHVFHQVGHDSNVTPTEISGWEYWVAKTTEKTDEVEQHILSLCKRFGVEMDLML